jgi:hypothetical protein
MTYNIHGVEIRAILVHNHPNTDRSEVYFAHDLSLDDRYKLADSGIGVFYDPATSFRYLTVDTALLVGNADSKSVVKSCECGSAAVGSLKHSLWCPCN